MAEDTAISQNNQTFKVHFVSESRTAEVSPGATILDAAVKAGVKLYTACGGGGICGKCVVELLPGGSQVLACHFHIARDLQVNVPRWAQQARHKILQEGIEQDVVVCPVFSKAFIRLPEGTPLAVVDVLRLASFEKQYYLSDAAASAIKQFPPSELDSGVTALCRLDAFADTQENYVVVAFEPGDTATSFYGVAVDIGTTTMVATLVDLNTGDVLATSADLNPQNVFGDDVISRISHGQEESGLKQLHDVTIAGINELIAQLCGQRGISPQNIYEVSIVGNTTMNHIFLSLPIRQLGHSPYNAWSVDAHDVEPSKLGLKINPAGNIHTVENIAGFVGADTVGVAVATRMDKVEKMTLVLDIGTNGEIILGTKDRLFAASCAAGPAFEGARISQGSRAMHGAIERIAYNPASGDIETEVIGGISPVSICGSGLIDAVGVLLELGIVDVTGRFVSPDKVKAGLTPKMMARFTTKNDQLAFVLAHGGADLADIILTQKDLREVQLAKAAIRAGIKLLQAKVGIDDSQIDQFLVAGAFGNYIDPAHAMRIGLLPTIPMDKVKFVGNAAASGAKLVLLNRHLRTLAETLARHIQYVEIGHEAEFANVFSDCLFF
jgi:uncharacterized 2Fe-2S/4Fe-4S cluster protein (DUF4445 family)